MKKVLVSVIIISMLYSSAIINSYAEEISLTEEETTEQTVNQTTYMNIDDAINYALEHKCSIKSAEAAILVNKYSKGAALKNYNNLNKVKDGSTFQSVLALKGFELETATLKYDNSVRELEVLKKDCKNNVKTNFYTYFSSVEKLDIAKTNQDNAKEKLGFAKTRLDTGIISQLDYESFELAVMKAENAYTQAQRTVNQCLENIKYAIDFPVNEELVITGSMPEINVEFVSADEAVKLSKSLTNYITLEKNFELAQKRWEYAENYYFPSEHSYYIEKYTYEQAKADYASNVNALEQNIKSAYNNLLNQRDNLNYTEKELEHAKKLTDVAYTKYEMGLMTASDYIETEQNYFTSTNGYLDAKLAYRTAALKYKATYTTTE